MDADSKSSGASAGFSVSANVGAAAGGGVSASVGGAAAVATELSGFAPSSSHGQSEDEQKEPGAEETDADGYHVEQRMQTEQQSQSQEVRELDDGRTETHHKAEKEIRLEEVKSRELEPRPATSDEIRALVVAQFDGGCDAEIQVCRDVTVEEFTRTERMHGKIDGGTGETDTESTVKEEHRTEKISEQPQWKAKAVTSGDEDMPEQSVEAPVVNLVPPVEIPIISVDGEAEVGVSVNAPQIAVTEGVSVEPPAAVMAGKPEKSKGKGIGVFGKFKLSPKQKGTKVASDIGEGTSEGDVSRGSSLKGKLNASGVVDVEPMDISVEVESPSVIEGHGKHEIKHKRHVIEEVVLEDTDTFYEELPKKRKLFARGKENSKPPDVERRRSTGEIPSPAESLPPATKTASTSNVSSEPEITFVVQHDVPKDRKRWTMPAVFSKRLSRADDIPEIGEAGGERKLQGGPDKQEEVVLEDEDLFTDSSIDRKKWGFRKKKTGKISEPAAVIPDKPGKPKDTSGKKWSSLPFSHKTGGKPASTETVTFIVHSDEPTGYIKVEPRMEGDDGSEPGAEGKAGYHGSIELPKWKLFDRKPKSSSSDDGENGLQKTDDVQKPGKKWFPGIDFGIKFGKKGHVRDDTEPEVVTYIVEQPTPGEPAKVKGQIGFEWPKFHLKFKQKSGKEEVSQEHGEGEIVTYVIEKPDLPAESLSDSSHGGFEWPKLNIHFAGKFLAAEEGTGESKIVTPNFIIDHVEPEPDTAEVDVSGMSIKKPILEFSIGAECSKEFSLSPETETQFVTYVVEQPSESGTSSAQLHWPKLKFHYSIKNDPAEEDGKPGCKTYVVKHITPVPKPVSDDTSDNTGGPGFHWPRVRLHIGGKHTKPAKVEAKPSEETVTYVVDHPTEPEGSGKTKGLRIKMPNMNFHLGSKSKKPDGSDTDTSGDNENYVVEEIAPLPHDTGDVTSGGSFGWPKFRLRFAEKSDKNGDDRGLTQTVTYVVENPEAPKEKAHGGFDLPRLKLHFGSKSSDSGEKETGETLTYVVEKSSPSGSEGDEVEAKGGVKWPKLDVHFGASPTLPQSSITEGSMEKYVVEQPDMPAQSEAEGGCKGLHIQWPKPQLHFGAKGTKQHEGDTNETEPECVTYVVEQPKPEASDTAKSNVQRGIDWPKLHLSFGKRGKKNESDVVQMEPETVTYIVEHPEPAAGETDDDATRSGKIKFPKFKLHFRSKWSKDDKVSGDSDGSEAVTYVVEEVDPIVEDIADVETDTGFTWPKLQVRFGARISEETGGMVEDTKETFIYVVENPALPMAEIAGRDRGELPKIRLHFKGKSDIAVGDVDSEGGQSVLYVMDPTSVSDDRKEILTIPWPNLDVHFGLKSVKPDPTEGEGGFEDLTYTVDHVIPVPAAGKGGFKINWPKFNWHFGGKTKTPKAGEVDVPVSEEREVGEHKPSSAETKTGGKIELPKFSLHFGRKSAKGELGSESTDENVTFVVRDVDPVPVEPGETDGGTGFPWPKLNVRFGAVTLREAEGEDTFNKAETVVYVVEQPVPLPSGAGEVEGGEGFHWPKFSVDFGGRGSVEDTTGSEGGQNVNYVVEHPPGPSTFGDVKGHAGVTWPKLNVHFGIKSPINVESNGENSGQEVVTYVIDNVIPLPTPGELPVETSGGHGIHFPKIKLHHGGKGGGDIDVKGDVETVTYIVQPPPASGPSDIEDTKGRAGINWPKFNVHFGKSGTLPEDELKGQPENVAGGVEVLEPEPPVAKGKGKFELPKFGWHRGGKPRIDAQVSGEKVDETVIFVVKQVDPIPIEPAEIESGGGFQWPKLKVNFGAQTSEGDDDTKKKKVPTATLR